MMRKMGFVGGSSSHPSSSSIIVHVGANEPSISPSKPKRRDLLQRKQRSRAPTIHVGRGEVQIPPTLGPGVPPHANSFVFDRGSFVPNHPSRSSSEGPSPRWGRVTTQPWSGSDPSPLDAVDLKVRDVPWADDGRGSYPVRVLSVIHGDSYDTHEAYGYVPKRSGCGKDRMLGRSIGEDGSIRTSIEKEVL